MIDEPVYTNLKTMSHIVRHRTHRSVSPGDKPNRLRAYIKTENLSEGERLPPERDLASILNMSRGALRQALAVLESSGEVWRHVGKGTFVGQRQPANEDDFARQLAQRSNPVEVIEARLTLEPRLAALAALRGTEKDFSDIGQFVPGGNPANPRMQLQATGDEFHYAVARTAKNTLLYALFESLFRVRALTSWGRLRPAVATEKELAAIWCDHTSIFEAIKARDPGEASRLMYNHIEDIQKRITMGHEALYETKNG